MTDTEIIAREQAPALPRDNNSLVLASTKELVEGVEKKFYWIDATVLNSVEMCGQLHEYNHILNLRLPNPDEIMENGSFIHDMLQVHYLMKKARVPYNQIIRQVTAFGIENRNHYGLNPEAADFCVRNYGEYAEHFALDGWYPIEVEATFSKVLYEDNGIVIVAVGVIDLIPDTKAGHVVVDHKSYFRWREPIRLNNQLMMYSWATEIPHVIFNKIGFQKSYKADKKFRRVQYIFTPNNIEVWLRHAIYWAKEAIKYQETNFWPRNYTSCDKFRGCRYIPLCEANEDVVEFKMQAQFVKGKPWDPSKRDAHKKLPIDPSSEDSGIES